MAGDDKQIESQQCEILSAFAKIACAGSHSLISNADPPHWKTSTCTLCDVSSSLNEKSKAYWNEKHNGEDWKDVVAAMLTITKEAKFQESSKARVHMAVVIGRVFSHISDADYLNLEICELGQWLLGSMSRSLRELKLAAV